MGIIGFLKEKLRKNDFLRHLYLFHFKRFDGKVRIYLTLECNLSCHYCVNRFLGKIKKYKLVSGTDWIKAINRERRDVAFTGGEPTLHPDFIEIINGIDPKLHVKVYTNFKWNNDFLKRYIKEIKRQVEFYGSYHPPSGRPEQFIKIVNELKKHNKFNGSIHAIRYRNQEKFLREVSKIFKKKSIDIEIDKDQYEVYDYCAKKFDKKVLCSKKVILIAPDGYRYQCVSKIVRGLYPLENFIKGHISSEKIESICFGYCAPCDGLGEVSFKEL